MKLPSIYAYFLPLLLLAVSACDTLAPDDLPTEPPENNRLFLLSETLAVVDLLNRHNITTTATVRITVPPKNGQLTLVQGGVYAYTPNEGFTNGFDQATFEVSTPNLPNPIIDEIIFEVTQDDSSLPCGSNLRADAFIVGAEELLVANLAANDIVCLGQGNIQETESTILEGPSLGTATINGLSLSYTAGTEDGEDALLIRSIVTQGASVNTYYSYVTINVSTENCNYIAFDDEFTVLTPSDSSDTLTYTLDVLANDSLVCRDTLMPTPTARITLVGVPSHGTVEIDSSGSHHVLHYTPENGFDGTDIFVHEITFNGHSNQQETVVNIAQSDTVGTQCYVSATDFLIINEVLGANTSYTQVVDVLGNDKFCTPSHMAQTTITLDSAGAKGRACVVFDQDLGRQVILYTPYSEATGEDNLIQTIRLPSGAERTETLAVSITPTGSGGGPCELTARNDHFIFFVSRNEGCDSAGEVDFYLPLLANDDKCGEDASIDVLISFLTGIEEIGFDGQQGVLYVKRQTGFLGSYSSTYELQDGTSIDTATFVVEFR